MSGRLIGKSGKPKQKATPNNINESIHNLRKELKKLEKREARLKTKFRTRLRRNSNVSKKRETKLVSTELKKQGQLKNIRRKKLDLETQITALEDAKSGFMMKTYPKIEVEAKVFKNAPKVIADEIPAPVHISNHNFFDMTAGNGNGNHNKKAVNNEAINANLRKYITPHHGMVHAFETFKNKASNKSAKLSALQSIAKMQTPCSNNHNNNSNNSNNNNNNNGNDSDDNKTGGGNDQSVRGDMNYKLHLDLDHASEMQNAAAFEADIKAEIAAALGVNVEDVIINAIEAGSIRIEITIRDPLGTYKAQLVEDMAEYALSKDEYGHWTINQCIGGRDMNAYFCATNSQTFDASTLMWQSLLQHFPHSYENMVTQSKAKVAQLQASYPRLTFDQIAAIYLYTTNFLYQNLSAELYAHNTSKFADYICVLVTALAKLPMVWRKTYRGMSSRYLTQNPAMFDNYAKGTVFRWDGMSSTSVSKAVAEKFGSSGVCFEIEHGFHGRDVQPFSEYAAEDEILYPLSMHFLITGKRVDTRVSPPKTWFTVTELAFPWGARAMLWVDDQPENNHALINAIECSGIMVIPKVSTKQAIDFLDFMGAILAQKSGATEFRIITDMNRYEKVHEYEENSPVTLISNAGAVLVKELRDKNYAQPVLIFTSGTQSAIDKCQAIGVDTNAQNLVITTSTTDCQNFAKF